MGQSLLVRLEICSVVKMSTHCRVQERSHNEQLDDKMTN